MIKLPFKPGTPTLILPTGQEVATEHVADFQLRFYIKAPAGQRIGFGYAHNDDGSLMVRDIGLQSWQSPNPDLVFDGRNGGLSPCYDNDQLIITHLACSSDYVELRLIQQLGGTLTGLPVTPRTFSGPQLRNYTLLKPIVVSGANGSYLHPIVMLTREQDRKLFTLDMGCLLVKAAAFT